MGKSRYANRVAKGANWLDRCGPYHWWWEIDLDQLNMAETKACILGQLYGDYGQVQRIDKIAHGFTIDDGLHDISVSKYERAGHWLDLHRCWLIELEVRSHRDIGLEVRSRRDD